MRRNIGRTPKVFQSNYQPPQKFDWGAYRSLLPLFWLVLIVGGFLALTQLPMFTIKEVVVSGTVDQAATDQLKSLVGHSLFSRQVNQTLTKLRTQNLTLSSADCQRGLPDTLRCQITERQPVFLWQRQNQLYLIDSSGLVYQNFDPTTLNSLTTIEDRAAAQIAIGQFVAGPEILNYYQKLAKSLTDNGLAIDHLFIDQSLYQVGVLLKGSTNAAVPFPNVPSLTVLFAANRPVDDQVNALVTLLKQKSSVIKEHVDVRVAEYAYYK